MKTISRYIMTLALLLTAVTGAWAGEEPQLLTTITFDANGPVYSESGIVTLSSTGSGITSAGMYFIAPINPTETMVATVDVATGKDVSKVVFYGYDGDDFVYPLEDTEAPYVCYANAEGRVRSLSSDLSNPVGVNRIGKIEVYGHAEPTIDVTPVTGKTNEWTFSMPGSDVVLTPIYAKAAAFATTGTEPDVKTLLPEAAEGVIAGTDASLIADGTGIVAFAGTSTEVTQGTLMYAIGTSATEAPDLTAFSADVPTAENIADDGATLYVWYYIKGADAPDGQQATEENTFNDTEPACLTVTVLTNKFDITLNAANANTIEAGKATVTVGGTAATVTEGKLQGVKMGSEVKLKANTGYKFRKVEVKKGSGDTGKSLAEATVGMIIGSNGKAYAADDKDNLPEGVTVAAKVCYVDGTGHGLALALTDEEGYMEWSTAQTTCDAHTPAITGGTWKLATKDEWNLMINAAGSHTALRDGFSSVGGTNMQSATYWSSTEEGNAAWDYSFEDGVWCDDSKGSNYYVRACLAF
jgi:hypothetical protein